MQSNHLKIYYAVSSTTAINLQTAPIKTYCTESLTGRGSNPDLHSNRDATALTFTQVPKLSSGTRAHLSFQRWSCSQKTSSYRD